MSVSMCKRLLTGRKKIVATRKLAWGNYFEVESALMRFESEHFNNSCSAKRSVKEETTVKQKRRKISFVRKILHWLVDDSNHTSLSTLIKEVDRLGRDENGYFALNWRVSSSKGIYFFSLLYLHQLLFNLNLFFLCILHTTVHLSYCLLNTFNLNRFLLHILHRTKY